MSCCDMRPSILPFFYAVLGITFELPQVATRFYARDSLHYNPATVNFILSLAALPWIVKPLYGLLSDSVPIAGQRRRPYLLGGSCIAAASWLMIAACSPSTGLALTCVFMGQLGLVVSDVIADSLVVEHVKAHESRTDAGKLQSITVGCRFGGALLASFFSGSALEWVSPRVVFAATSVPLMLMVGIVAVWFNEPPCTDPLYSHVRAERDFDGGSLMLESDSAPCCIPHRQLSRRTALMLRLRRLMSGLRQPAVWRPTLFILLLNAMPSSSTVIFYFWTGTTQRALSLPHSHPAAERLHFSPAFLSLTNSLRHSFGMLGTLMYRRWFRHVPLRRMVLRTVLAITLLSAAQLILVTRLNVAMGMPDWLFVVSEDCVDSIVEALLLLPITVLAARLCPDGVEASMYASIISASNAGNILSQLGGSAITAAFGVTMTNFDNLVWVTLVCTATIPLPLLVLRLIPPVMPT